MRVVFRSLFVFLLWLGGMLAGPARAQDPGARFDDLRDQAAARQAAGFDASLLATMLEDVRGLLRNNRLDRAGALMDRIDRVLDTLVTAPPLPTTPQARLQIDAAQPGDPIPHLAGNVVLKSAYDDPVFARFMTEIGPNLVQIKLFLADLNAARDNYCYLQRPGLWEETIRQVRAAGGEVMLHLRQVPARLTLIPEANTDPEDGKAPLADPEGVNEWRTIVQEVVTHFVDAGAPVQFLQDLGEPNIGTNWYDPDDLLSTRPLNAEAFADHFRHTIETAHTAAPDVQVGGPTLWLGKNDTLWWAGFLDAFAQQPTTPDFISVHIYDPNFAIWDYGARLAREQMQAHGFGDLPLYMTEWNVAGTLTVPDSLFQTHFNAAHAIQGFLRILDTGLDHTYFQLNAVGDLVCADLPPIRAASTQTNLLLVDDGQIYPNTSYNAFRLFAMLRDADRLPLTTDDPGIRGVAGVRGNEEVLVLLSSYAPLSIDFDSLAYRMPDLDRSRTVDVQIDNLPFSDYTLDVYRIDATHSNIHTLGPEGAELAVAQSGMGQGTSLHTTLDLPAYGVYMARLKNRAAETGTGAFSPPPAFSLTPNYPNPVRRATTFTFTLPRTEAVILTVFDVLGRRVAVPLDAVRAAGPNTVVFDATALPNGLYFYRLTAGKQQAGRSFLVLR